MKCCVIAVCYLTLICSQPFPNLICNNPGSDSDCTMYMNKSTVLWYIETILWVDNYPMMTINNILLVGVVGQWLCG